MELMLLHAMNREWSPRAYVFVDACRFEETSTSQHSRIGTYIQNQLSPDPSEPSPLHARQFDGTFLVARFAWLTADMQQACSLHSFDTVRWINYASTLASYNEICF